VSEMTKSPCRHYRTFGEKGYRGRSSNVSKNRYWYTGVDTGRKRQR